MSMYKFVKGARLFMQGKREENDYDNVADSFSGRVEDEDEELRRTMMGAGRIQDVIRIGVTDGRGGPG